jgi:HNH endonuclease
MPTAKGSVPWNAGTGKGWTDKRGYRWLYVQENGRRVARREHRVLMERHLGRKLEPWEIVHHKDENPTNNELVNLELTTFGEHASLHSNGSRRAADTRRSMEAFALMREEMKRVRGINADLLATCEMALDCLQMHWDNESARNVVRMALGAAIAKATQ